MNKYLVYGNPIAQSKSPFIHQMFADQTGQNLSYDRHCSSMESFVEDVNSFFKSGGVGANVTAPFKELARSICDSLSDRAKEAGAVNTLCYLEGKIHGDNTDGVGLVQDIIRHGVDINGSNILLLGAGGAVKGVILPILEQSPDKLHIANRTVSKAEMLQQQFGEDKITVSSFEDIPSTEYDLIINATSAGLSGQMPDLPARIVSIDTVCYDMVYGTDLTPFLLWSQTHNAKQVIDGLGMLVGQAAESFYQWRGVQPDISPVLAALRKELAK